MAVNLLQIAVDVEIHVLSVHVLRNVCVCSVSLEVTSLHLIRYTPSLFLFIRSVMTHIAFGPYDKTWRVRARGRRFENCREMTKDAFDFPRWWFADRPLAWCVYHSRARPRSGWAVERARKTRLIKHTSPLPFHLSPLSQFLPISMFSFLPVSSIYICSFFKYLALCLSFHPLFCPFILLYSLPSFIFNYLQGLVHRFPRLSPSQFFEFSVPDQSYSTLGDPASLNKLQTFIHMSSRGSSIGIATGYGLDDRGAPRRPDRLWGSPNLSNGYRGQFPRG
jgi:hypothetical protein